MEKKRAFQYLSCVETNRYNLYYNIYAQDIGDVLKWILQNNYTAAECPICSQVLPLMPRFILDACATSDLASIAKYLNKMFLKKSLGRILIRVTKQVFIADVPSNFQSIRRTDTE